MKGNHLIIMLTAKSKLFAKMFWGGGERGKRLGVENTFLHLAFTLDLFVKFV